MGDPPHPPIGLRGLSYHKRNSLLWCTKFAYHFQKCCVFLFAQEYDQK